MNARAMTLFVILAGGVPLPGGVAGAEERAGEGPAGMTLHVIPQAHIDLAWWWRYDPDTVRVTVKHTLETAFQNMEAFPDYTFTFLQVPSIAPLEELHPELFYKMRYYVHNSAPLGERIPNPGAGGSAGRLAIGSGLYCEFDGSVPGGESLVRQCLYGKRYFKEQFGVDVRTAWFQDAWTHPWTLPQILKKCGIDSYMYTRPRPEERFMLVPDDLRDEYLATAPKEAAERIFWWESPDGSRVLAYRPLGVGGEDLPDAETIDEYLQALRRRYGVSAGVTLIGVGNHGGGAIRADVARMRRVMEERRAGQGKAALTFSTPERYVAALRDETARLPVLRDELVPTIRGAYTTRGEVKKGNRQSETRLLTLERFGAIAEALGGYTYPRQWLDGAWRKVLLNQFHDTISGTDIGPSIDDALARYREIAEDGEKELRRALESIVRRVDTRGEGTPIVVFNPLSWEREGLVEAELPFEGDGGVAVTDSRGAFVPAQLLEAPGDGRPRTVRVLFAAKVPATGYACYRAIRGPADRDRVGRLSARANVLENEFFEVKVDPVTGALRSVFDKTANREILREGRPGNLIQVTEDFGDSEGFLMSPKGFGEYPRWSGRTWNVDEAAEVRAVESGPARATLQVKSRFGLARFVQRIHLYPGIPLVDFELVLDWQGKNKMVKVAFPLGVSSDSATYEIQYGAITRPSVGEEHVAQKWVDVSEEGYGVSLLNDSRYGHDVEGSTVRLSVLRSPDHPVDASEEDGVHRVRYALYPHRGGWREAGTVRRGYEFNYPLVAVVGERHPGDLPETHAFLSAEPGNVVVSVLKKAERSDDLIVRFYETSGDPARARLRLSPFVRFDGVHEVDLLENELGVVPHRGPVIETDVGRHSIESIRLIEDAH
jgi:alpha-mannosidase